MLLQPAFPAGCSFFQKIEHFFDFPIDKNNRSSYIVDNLSTLVRMEERNMTGWSFFFMVVGITSLAAQMFRIIDLLERPARRRGRRVSVAR